MLLNIKDNIDIWAFSLSVFALGWNFCRDFVNRARLDFQVDFAPEANKKDTTISKNKIIIRIFNKGSSPLCIKKIEGIVNKKKPVNIEVLLSSKLDRVIEAKHMTVLVIDLDAWELESPFKKIVFHTTDDKKFIISHKKLKRLEKDIKAKESKEQKYETN